MNDETLRTELKRDAAEAKEAKAWRKAELCRRDSEAEVIKHATETDPVEVIWADLVATRAHYKTLVKRVDALRCRLGVPADAGFDGIESCVAALLSGGERVAAARHAEESAERVAAANRGISDALVTETRQETDGKEEPPALYPYLSSTPMEGLSERDREAAVAGSVKDVYDLVNAERCLVGRHGIKRVISAAQHCFPAGDFTTGDEDMVERVATEIGWNGNGGAAKMMVRIVMQACETLRSSDGPAKETP